MIKIDLVTGFLGSGKTTFIREYAKFLLAQGEHIGIVENDFGAVNVDILMLQDIEGENCSLVPVVGGNTAAEWMRRFRSKLIALSMEGVDRVIAEPSGIYDTEEFFEVMHDELISSRYEIGSIFAVVDSGLSEGLSPAAEYMLASQVAAAGEVILSKTEDKSPEELLATESHLDALLRKYKCDTEIIGKIFSKDFTRLDEKDFHYLMDRGIGGGTCRAKKPEGNFESLFFMNHGLKKERFIELIKSIFHDKNCGEIMRIKGFLPDERGSWLQINATPESMDISELARGQEIIIVIGEKLNKTEIEKQLKPKQ